MAVVTNKVGHFHVACAQEIVQGDHELSSCTVDLSKDAVEGQDIAVFKCMDHIGLPPLARLDYGELVHDEEINCKNVETFVRVFARVAKLVDTLHQGGGGEEGEAPVPEQD